MKSRAWPANSPPPSTTSVTRLVVATPGCGTIGAEEPASRPCAFRSPNWSMSDACSACSLKAEPPARWSWRTEAAFDTSTCRFQSAPNEFEANTTNGVQACGSRRRRYLRPSQVWAPHPYGLGQRPPRAWRRTRPSPCGCSPPTPHTEPKSPRHLHHPARRQTDDRKPPVGPSPPHRPPHGRSQPERPQGRSSNSTRPKRKLPHPLPLPVRTGVRGP